MAAATKCSFEVLSHPHVLSRLSPSDFYMFQNLKTNLRGRNFGSVINAVDEYFGDHDDGFCFRGISKLEQRWRKCIEVKGHYIEK